MSNEAVERLDRLLHKARACGADAADALMVESESLSVSWRAKNLESLEREESAVIGVRIFIGARQASCAGSDLSADAIGDLAARAVAMARVAPEDPFCGLAPKDRIAVDFPNLDLEDRFDISSERLIEAARGAEDSALSVKGVERCDGAGASALRTRVALGASNGFFGNYEKTHYGIGVSALAGTGTGMEMGSEGEAAVHFADLAASDVIGKKAGEKAVRNLGARTMPSCKAPVVFDPEEACGLLGYLAGAISGAAVARKASFLGPYLGKMLFPSCVTIIDDPFRTRGLCSRPFDGEGISPQRRAIVEDGVLTTWLLDLRSARQLGLESTGHAARGTSGPPAPSPSNFYMQGGTKTPAELLRDAGCGFYVTETMGMGVNGVTGDYSVAARGFWIEGGEKTFPVSEMTIAGNLKDMFLHMEVANDLVFRFGIDAPTILIDGMTIAGG